MMKPKTRRIRVIEKVQFDYISLGDRYFGEGIPIKIGGRILESHYEDVEVPEEDLEL